MTEAEFFDANILLLSDLVRGLGFCLGVALGLWAIDHFIRAFGK